MSNEAKWYELVLGGVLYLYFAIGVLFFLTMSTQYISKHGFWAYTFYGDIVVGFKSLIWPILLFWN